MGKHCTEIVTNFYICGGNEQSTHKYVAELLGKETIDTNNYGKSTGHSGSYSTNYQLAGRELMTPDEVRLLDNRYALLFIRGERPIIDFKYDILKHPNVKHTTDGEGEAYIHGGTEHSVASVMFEDNNEELKLEDIENIKNKNYEIMSDEDIEKYIKEEIDNEK